MKLIVGPSRLRGEVLIPASKSHTIRAVAIAALAEGKSIIRNPLFSGDAQAAVDCYRAFGAGIDTSDPQAWHVEGLAGCIKPPRQTIDVLNSGTTLRIAMGSAALARVGRATTFTGDHQIQTRSVGPLMTALGDMGARCVSLKGNECAPVTVAGTLRGGHTSIECRTSQYLTSLLMCCPLAEGDSEIDVTLLNEPGYVEMTLDWLDRQGIACRRDGLRHFEILGGQRFKGYDAPVPADFSSATFFLCGGALFADGNGVTLRGLDMNDSQPDKAVVEYLRAMGADVVVQGDGITVRPSELTGAEIDMNATPDALPAMAVTAAFARGRTVLGNVPQARYKETDRIACMAAELGKMGVRVEELQDGLVVCGGRPRAAILDGRYDHRIVMALALAAMGASGGESTIETAEATAVTFPGFAELMEGLGADIHTVE